MNHSSGHTPFRTCCNCEGWGELCSPLKCWCCWSFPFRTPNSLLPAGNALRTKLEPLKIDCARLCSAIVLRLAIATISYVCQASAPCDALQLKSVPMLTALFTKSWRPGSSGVAVSAGVALSAPVCSDLDP
jgi:hypothetical protein